MESPASDGLCVSILAATILEFKTSFESAIEQGADLVEWRTDALEPDETTRLHEHEAWLKPRADRIVFACRHPQQGGLDADEAIDAHSLLLWACGMKFHYIDIEHARYVHIDSLKEKVDLMLADVGRGFPRLLLSDHHVDDRPLTLERKFLDLCEYGAGTVKLVWHARHAMDNFEAFDLLQAAGQGASVFCSGTDGLPSRILGKKLGSKLTYCAMRRGEEAAPGQIPLADMLSQYHWKSIGSDTEVYGVMGDPVAHSLGPVVHNAAFAELGRDAVYVPFRVEGDGYAFASFISAIAERPWLDIRGLSVTSPHKQNAFMLVEEDTDPISRRIGAINTLRFDEAGVSGNNTDYQAAINWLQRGMRCSLPDLADRKIAVLGAGGLARCLVAGLRLIRTNVTVYNRTLESAQALADAFDCKAAALGDGLHPEEEIIINTTTVGMPPKSNDSPIDASRLSSRCVVFDAIYQPSETLLMKSARRQGCQVFGGLELFIDQAAMQCTIWTREVAPVGVMREAALAHLKAHQ